MKRLFLSLIFALSCFYSQASEYNNFSYQDIVFRNPIDLVIPQRLDIIAKYIYAWFYENTINSSWGLEIYDRFLQVYNNTQEGIPQKSFPHFYTAKKHTAKNNLNDYISSFKTVLNSIKQHGPDPEQSLVPINKDNVILDGAHRVAAYLLYNFAVPCTLIKHPQWHDKHDVSFTLLKNKTTFTQTGLEEKYLDSLALQYCTLKKNTYIVTMFDPNETVQKHAIKMLSTESTIVYQKNFKITPEGKISLIKSLYPCENWTGNWKNNFYGAQQKANGCFSDKKDTYTVTAFLVESPSLKHLVDIKYQLRKQSSLGHHALHINDTHKETVAIAQILFNKNSLHHINHAHKKQLDNFETFLTRYKQWIADNNLNSEYLCIDGSAILSAYGLRDCRDLDVLHHGYDDLIKHMEPLGIGSHNHEVHYHKTTADNIIFNPENHFYYQGLKFTSLPMMITMKTKRNEPKDKIDVALMEMVL